jgi:hypothetical protein
MGDTSCVVSSDVLRGLAPRCSDYVVNDPLVRANDVTHRVRAYFLSRNSGHNIEQDSGVRLPIIT